MAAGAAGGKGWCRTFLPRVAGLVESKSDRQLRPQGYLGSSPLGSASLTMISVPVMGSLTRLEPCSAFLYRSVGRSIQSVQPLIILVDLPLFEFICSIILDFSSVAPPLACSSFLPFRFLRTFVSCLSPSNSPSPL